MMKQGLDNNWGLIWWLLGSVCIPVTLPWIIYQYFQSLRHRSSMSKLQDKVVLITGASSGLGEALAHVFYGAGCRVILAARRREELERVRDNLLVSHTTVPTHPPVLLPLDLSDLNSLPGHVNKALEIFSRIDILVNNAGISHRGTVMNTNVDVDIKIMLVNYFGQVALTKAVLPTMIKQSSGHIVMISSVQGRLAIPCRSAYAASKHALQAFSDTLRAEVDPHNIKVSVITAGYIATSLSVNALTGTGASYGVMDSATAEGYKPEYAAAEILRAVVSGKHELLLCPFAPKAAITLRTLAPSIYFWIMAKRFRKSTNEQTSS